MPGAQPRLLMVTTRWPYPVNGGDGLRVHQLAKALRPHFDITLAALCQRPDVDTRPATESGIFCEAYVMTHPRWMSWMNAARAFLNGDALQVAYFRSAGFAAMVRDLASQHDVILAHLIRAAPYALQCDMPRVLEMTDAVSMSMSRAPLTCSSTLPRALLYRAEARRVTRFESDMLRRFDAVSVVSKVDAAELLKNAGRAEHPFLLVAPNGVAPAPSLQLGGSMDLAFIGNMRTLPNRDAIAFFVGEVLPEVRRRESTARLRVIGPIDARLARQLGRQDGVDVAGEVENLTSALHGAAGGICPVRMGAGIQNKVLEYLAHGLPVVTSPIGLQGVNALAGNHLLVARSVAEWVSHVVSVLRPCEEVRAMARRGRDWVTQHHDWAVCASPLVRRLVELGAA